MDVQGNSIIVAYEMDTTVVVELIKANQLDMVEALHDLPYLHSEYSSIILEARQADG